MTTEATNDCTRKNILICDTQPVAVEGMKWLIENTGDSGSLPARSPASKPFIICCHRSAGEPAGGRCNREEQETMKNRH